MTGGEAVQAAWAAYAGPAGSGSASVKEMVRAVGGTKAAAAVLRVTQRSVQRYIKGESGKGGQTRRASETQKALLGDAARKQQVKEAQAKGGVTARVAGKVNIGGRNYGDEYQGERHFEIALEPDEDQFWDALADGEWEEAADAIASEYVDGSTFGDLDDLSFE
jgi:predicted transcriptional regulator